jgi:hypothetical protein
MCWKPSVCRRWSTTSKEFGMRNDECGMIGTMNAGDEGGMNPNDE